MLCKLCGGEDFAREPFHYRWDGRRFDGMRCRGCGLVTLDPLPSDADLAKLYDGEYFARGLHGLDQLRQDYEQWSDAAMAASGRFLREELLARRPEARSIFEIGAAMGHSLATARQAGLAVAGLEISPAAVARAREKFGIELICGNIEAFDPEPWAERWDLVYAGDLFEHLRDPAGVLGKVARLLAPGGLFFIRIPSTLNLLSTRLAAPLLRATGRSRLLPDPPYHLYEYTPATIGRLFARHFARVEIRQEAMAPGRLNVKGGSAAYRAKRALQVVNAPLTRLTGRFGDRLTVCGWKAD